MIELLKAQKNRGIKPALHFLRDKEGHEIDALIETGPDTFQAVEIKSGETIASDSARSWRGLEISIAETPSTDAPKYLIRPHFTRP